MPDWKPEIRERLAGLKLEPVYESEIVEELAQHQDDRYQELLSEGVSPAQAEQTLRTELKESDRLIKEVRRSKPRHREPVRVEPGGNLFTGLWQDLRYGWRSLIKTPGFTSIAVIMLALGIGACTAVFSVVDALLLRPLPFKDPDRLMLVQESFPKLLEPAVNLSGAEFLDYRDRNRVFSQTAGLADFKANLTAYNTSERVQGARVSASFFPLLGVAPALGRNFAFRLVRR